MSGIARELLPSPEEAGHEMHDLMRELYPICRSLTGDGVRRTLAIVAREAPFEAIEVPSGTPVYDWTVPREWNIRDAWIADPSGRRIVDFRDSNLHVLGYSTPVRARLRLEELRKHVHTMPEHPDWIPLRTSYYEENWGFCLTQQQVDALPEGEYEVCIDASLEDGSLTYAEAYVPGALRDEILLSSYICHPSVCNDGISGIALITLLAKYLSRLALRYSYRFLLSPGTIGPLTWLARNEHAIDHVKYGLVASCVGDTGTLTYKKTRRGDTEIDHAAENVLRHSGVPYRIEDFVPWGGDERQFSSPGFALDVGSLMRSSPGTFAEYHTSADDLDFVTPGSLGDSFDKYLAILDLVETNMVYVSQNPKGEPHLSRRGLYRAISTGAPRDDEVAERAILWVLNLSDGHHTLLDISDRAGIPFPVVRQAALTLRDHALLAAAEDRAVPS